MKRSLEWKKNPNEPKPNADVIYHRIYTNPTPSDASLALLQAMPEFFKKASPKQIHEHLVSTKPIRLDNAGRYLGHSSTTQPSSTHPTRPTPNQPTSQKTTQIQSKLSKNTLKSLSLLTSNHQIPYNDHIPLNNMWNQYIQTLIGKNVIGTPESMQKLMQADFHGALIRVVFSAVPTYVAKEGIVIEEHTNALVIVTQKNEYKTLIKDRLVFSVVIHGKTMLIHGCQFKISAANRTKMRCKAVGTMQII